MVTPSSESPPGCTLAVHVVPNAPTSAVAGWHGDALKVRVHAPATEGRANDELCAFLAAHLGLPRRAVRLRHGASSRRKLLQLDGLTADELRRRLGA